MNEVTLMRLLEVAGFTLIDHGHYVLNNGRDNMVSVHIAPDFISERYAIVCGLPMFETIATDHAAEVLALVISGLNRARTNSEVQDND